MPSRTNSTTKPTAPLPAKRFELPALEFKFGSLTEGTDIPPPLPSPAEAPVPTPPETPKEEGKVTVTTNGKADATSPKSNSSNFTTGSKRPAEDNPTSPTLSSRPGSIRRLFSRGLLNNAYANGEEQAAEGGHGRPPSRSASSIADPKKAKRSSGWFSRLRSSDSAKRASMPLSPTTPVEERKSMGPPPPMIPELSELKSKLDHEQDLSFGNDLFKNIK